MSLQRAAGLKSFAASEAPTHQVRLFFEMNPASQFELSHSKFVKTFAVQKDITQVSHLIDRLQDFLESELGFSFHILLQLNGFVLCEADFVLDLLRDGDFVTISILSAVSKSSPDLESSFSSDEKKLRNSTKNSDSSFSVLRSQRKNSKYSRIPAQKRLKMNTSIESELESSDADSSPDSSASENFHKVRSKRTSKQSSESDQESEDLKSKRSLIRKVRRSTDFRKSSSENSEPKKSKGIRISAERSLTEDSSSVETSQRKFKKCEINGSDSTSDLGSKKKNGSIKHFSSSEDSESSNSSKDIQSRKIPDSESDLPSDSSSKTSSEGSSTSHSESSSSIGEPEKSPFESVPKNSKISKPNKDFDQESTSEDSEPEKVRSEESEQFKQGSGFKKLASKSLMKQETSSDSDSDKKSNQSKKIENFQNFTQSSQIENLLLNIAVDSTSKGPIEGPSTTIRKKRKRNKKKRVDNGSVTQAIPNLSSIPPNNAMKVPLSLGSHKRKQTEKLLSIERKHFYFDSNEMSNTIEQTETSEDLGNLSEAVSTQISKNESVPSPSALAQLADSYFDTIPANVHVTSVQLYDQQYKPRVSKQLPKTSETTSTPAVTPKTPTLTLAPSSNWIPFTGFPIPTMRLAFKVMELSAQCTAELSDVKYGTVMSVDFPNKLVTVKVEAQNTVHRERLQNLNEEYEDGKLHGLQRFAIDDDDEMDEEGEEVLELNWDAFMDVKYVG
ncbi:hypothetical protein HK096_005464 [Nowakowskiella sp. JEL0078]|nr:hypothetical protein HK096_005464 [Nowakowskiella sp. JEL0078]